MPQLGEIVSFIKENRVSTTEVADALGKTGHLPGPLPLSRGLHKVGPIRCLFAAGGTNYEIHAGATEVQPGEVIVIFIEGFETLAVLGELITRYLLLYKKAEAVVVSGLVRDVSVLLREGYPVWASGVSPIGMSNGPGLEFSPDKAASIRARLDGGIAVCDDTGVVLAEASQVNPRFRDALESVEKLEDLWHYCLDTLKWDTKQIVCDRLYEADTELMERFRLNS